jgi:hypothetical protein
MKEHDIENLKSGDKIVFIKSLPRTNTFFKKFKIGDELYFNGYDLASDIITFIDKDFKNCYYFSPKIHKCIEMESEIKRKKRNQKINIVTKKR